MAPDRAARPDLLRPAVRERADAARGAAGRARHRLDGAARGARLLPVRRAHRLRHAAARRLPPIGSSLFTFAMITMGFVGLATWDGVFPDRRDARVLGSLPIRTSTLVLARLGALGSLFALFIVGTQAVARGAVRRGGDVRRRARLDAAGDARALRRDGHRLGIRLLRLDRAAVRPARRAAPIGRAACRRRAPDAARHRAAADAARASRISAGASTRMPGAEWMSSPLGAAAAVGVVPQAVTRCSAASAVPRAAAADCCA